MVLVGERKAFAALVLVFFAIQFGMGAFMGPGELLPLLAAMSGLYAVAFMGLVSGWFWARWFAMGLGVSGAGMGALMGYQVGPEPLVIFWTVSHAIIGLFLLGEGPAAMFDGRKDWRDRFRMDEPSANRLGKSITRAGASLPYLVMAGLAPRADGLFLGQGGTVGAFGPTLAGIVVCGAALWGVRNLVQLRTSGVLFLGAAGLLAFWLFGGAHDAGYLMLGGLGAPIPGAGLVAGALLLGAAAPFAVPMVRFLRTR